ncbi:MAG: vitamin K epoxide reductase family protein [Polyangiales bacterium]
MPHAFVILGVLAALAGCVFSAVSTYDFVAHLDRQVHGLHCSFLPGVGGTDVGGESGCHVTMMSPYSSMLRTQLWGGLPISLPAFAVFAFLLAWGVSIALSGRQRDPRATGLWALFSLVPLVASAVMGTIALRELSAFCKLCVGIYVASVLLVLGAVVSYFQAERTAPREQPEPLSRGALGVVCGIAFLFVGSATVAYALNAPDFSRYAGTCGTLKKADDPQAILPLAGRRGGPVLLEVLDPLCPACRAFAARLERHPMFERADRKLLLFPLDDACNWMVDQAVHPGACAISEAVLCAGDQAEDVLAWAFGEQTKLIAEERAQKGSAARRVVAKFPALRGCVGSSKVRARLNRSLRFAVENQLPVLTPQLYVDGTRLCDADTDLGLDYMLTRLTARGKR